MMDENNKIYSFKATGETTLEELLEHGNHVNIHNKFMWYYLPIWFERKEDGTFIGFWEKNIPNYLSTFLEEDPLTQYDIESLGWKFKDSSTGGYHAFTGRACSSDKKSVWYELLWIEPIQYIDIYTVKDPGRNSAFYNTGDYFRGTIKNKSELKKLLTQLGI